MIKGEFMKKNQGFSMVELIIVIAIMAVLAGFLAPKLIQYMNKARLSVDIDTGNKIAKAILVAITDEKVRDNAVEHAEPWEVDKMDGNDFKEAVYKVLNVDKVEGKSKKDVNGNTLSPVFYYKLDANKNIVEIYYGGKSDDYQIYPKAGSKLIK